MMHNMVHKMTFSWLWPALSWSWVAALATTALVCSLTIAIMSSSEPLTLKKRESEMGTFEVGFEFADFANRPHNRGESLHSSSLSIHGCVWRLSVFPRGGNKSKMDREHVGIYLVRVDTGRDPVNARITFRTGDRTESFRHTFSGDTDQGFPNFETRDFVLDPANNCIQNGVFKVHVDFEFDIFWCPSNTTNKDLIGLQNNTSLAGVTFLVGLESFPAHKQILAARAPGLYEIAAEFPSDTKIEIPNVDPSIFGAFLGFLYSDELPQDMNVETAMRLLEVADKYNSSNLKLKVESKLAASNFPDDKVVNMLVFADSKNCPLLKEVAMDRFVSNKQAAIKSHAFQPLESPELLWELLVADTSPRTYAEDSPENMRVGTLRRKLHEAGLDVDGSRETLIKRLKTSTD